MPNMYIEALKSIITTGMPEDPRKPGRIRQGIHQIISGGAVEQPTPHYPSEAEQLLRGGAPEPPSAPGLFEREAANIGNQLIQTTQDILFGGAVEHPDQEAIAKRAAAAEKRRQDANTVLTAAAGLTMSGIKGAGGLAARGILAGVNALRKNGNKKHPTQQPLHDTPQLNAENGNVVDGEWKEI